MKQCEFEELIQKLMPEKWEIKEKVNEHFEIEKKIYDAGVRIGYNEARADCVADFIKTIDACKKDLRLKSDTFENLDSIEQEVFSLDILKEAINRIKGE